MHLLSLCFDDFLDDYDAFEEQARAGTFEDVTNPQDGVIYPGIGRHVPLEIAAEVTAKIAAIMSVSTDRIHYSIPMSLRLSVDGTKAPQQAHTDIMMGDYNFILYLDDGDIHTGTSIVKHISGMECVESASDVELLNAETNKYDSWKIVSMCQARKNRAAIIPSRLFHRAEPASGFGSSPQNGRLVLLAFFSIL